MSRVWMLSVDGQERRKPFAFLAAFKSRRGALGAMTSVAEHIGERSLVDATNDETDSLEFRGEACSYSIYTLEVQ